MATAFPAARQLDIFVYAGAFLIETLDLADVLAWKASSGIHVRILVADPDSAAVRMRATELPLDWLPGRCASTVRYLQPVRGIAVRQHDAAHYAREPTGGTDDSGRWQLRVLSERYSPLDTHRLCQGEEA